MKVLKTLIVIATLTTGAQSFAAIACRPGMNNCPGSPDPVPSPTPRPAPELFEVYVGGMAIIPSPDCAVKDLKKAIREATMKAERDAEFFLGSEAMLAKPLLITQSCEQSTYAEAAKGNSWIVQVMGKYELPKPY